MSDCVYPLDLQSAKCSFPWLLEGTEREQRKIVGTTGLCSKLMHYYAKITHLSSRLWMVRVCLSPLSPEPPILTSCSTQRPFSDVYPAVGRELEKQLENFSQWSDLSEGHETCEALLTSCVLDGNGKVNSAERVTELVAETYVAAAQIYLQCRFFRCVILLALLMGNLLITRIFEAVRGIIPLFSEFSDDCFFASTTSQLLVHFLQPKPRFSQSSLLGLLLLRKRIAPLSANGLSLSAVVQEE